MVKGHTMTSSRMDAVNWLKNESEVEKTVINTVAEKQPWIR